MNMVECINHFCHTMCECGIQFKNNRDFVNCTQKELDAILEAFSQSVREIENSKCAVNREDFMKFYEETKQAMSLLLSKTAVDMIQLRKGKQFIDDHRDSFNIAVFGMVKAGKSYLGNFVMGNGIRNCGLSTEYNKIDSPNVSVIDKGEISERSKMAEYPDAQSGFFVDSIEATSTIQLFRLGGMRWIDTPGFGSMSKENEKLAEEYVTNADLIVYMCNSDSAGREKDFQELDRLYQARKRFVLLITQSDVFEEGIDENGNLYSELVAKSEQDRRQTEEYVYDTLVSQNVNIKRNEILTISAKLAEEALKERNQEKFDGSQMGAFLELLIQITNSEAAKLCLSTPRNRVQTTIRELISKLSFASEMIKKKREEFERKRTEILEDDIFIWKMKEECEGRCTAKISELVHKIENSRTTISSKEISDIMREIMVSVIQSNCAERFKDTISCFGTSMEGIPFGGVGDLKMRTDKIEYRQMVVSESLREPKGIREWIGERFFGKIYYKNECQHVTRYSTVELGVNQSEVIGEMQNAINLVFDTSTIKNIVLDVFSAYSKTIFDVMQAADMSIDSTNARLIKLLDES